MNRKFGLFAASVICTMLCAAPVYAEGWKQNDSGTVWKYEKSDGTEAKNEWLWIDGNHDCIAECYYFGNDGTMFSSTTTPDGYKVNESGAWVSEGNVMKCVVTTSNTYGTMPYVGIWKKAKALEHKAFAHFFSAGALYQTKVEIIQSIFPTAYQYFLEMIR